MGNNTNSADDDTALPQTDNQAPIPGVTSRLRFCGGSASIPRGVVTRKLYLCDNSDDASTCDESSVVSDRKRIDLRTECQETDDRMYVYM